MFTKLRTGILTSTLRAAMAENQGTLTQLLPKVEVMLPTASFLNTTYRKNSFEKLHLQFLQYPCNKQSPMSLKALNSVRKTSRSGFWTA